MKYSEETIKYIKSIFRYDHQIKSIIRTKTINGKGVAGNVFLMDPMQRTSIRVKAKPVPSKDIVWILCGGEIPDGMEVYRVRNDENYSIENLFIDLDVTKIQVSFCKHDKYPNKLFLSEFFTYKDGALLLKKKLSLKTDGGNNQDLSFFNRNGYKLIPVKGKPYLCHRLIYIYHNGDIGSGLQVDHINRKRDDNRIENLRVVTNQENQFNRSNVTGCYFDSTKCLWISVIKVDGKRVCLGSFKDKKDAMQAYRIRKKCLHKIGGVSQDFMV